MSLRRGPARLGFAGLGWIGRHRMRAILEDGAAEAAVLFDPCGEACAGALGDAPGAEVVGSYEELLGSGVDGVVIATPSALHAGQAIAALERGIAVFCQKPLARTGAETRAVIDAARASDRLLGVDLSYRHAAAFGGAVELARSGALGEVYAVELVFHNAYGPGKAWFRDAALSGGGCLIDLGVHLIDLALLALEGDAVEAVVCDLYCKGERIGGTRATGEPVTRATGAVEDYAAGQLRMRSGASVRIACSWNAHAGVDAVIGASFLGTAGGAIVRNVGGSFYDFEGLRATGTSRQVFAEPPDAWGGRAAAAWARRLANEPGFDASVESVAAVADALDLMYGRAGMLSPEVQPA